MRKTKSGEAWAGVQSCCLWVSVCAFLHLYFSLLSCVNEVLQAELDLSFTLRSCVDVCHWTLLLIWQTGCQLLRKLVWSERCEITSAHQSMARLSMNRHTNNVAFSHFAGCLVGYPRIPQGLELRGFKEMTNSGTCLISYLSKSHQKLTLDNCKSYAL